MYAAPCVSLRDYLQFADNTHNELITYGVTLSTSTLTCRIAELKVRIKTLQAVAIRLADVSNIWSMFARRRSHAVPPRITDAFPTSLSHANVRIPTNNNFAVTSVATSSNIPVGALYYIEDRKQHAVSINGVLIRGNLANVRNDDLRKTMLCKHGQDCENLVHCTYYHDPGDYLARKLEVPNNMTRNFTVGSWIYTKRPQVRHARRIGSQHCLDDDLAQLTPVQCRSEANNREAQLMHDILIYMTLHGKGLLPGYARWTI